MTCPSRRTVHVCGTRLASFSRAASLRYSWIAATSDTMSKAIPMLAASAAFPSKSEMAADPSSISMSGSFSCEARADRIVDTTDKALPHQPPPFRIERSDSRSLVIPLDPYRIRSIGTCRDDHPCDSRCVPAPAPPPEGDESRLLLVPPPPSAPVTDDTAMGAASADMCRDTSSGCHEHSSDRAYGYDVVILADQPRVVTASPSFSLSVV